VNTIGTVRGRLYQCRPGRGTGGQDDVRGERDQFCGVFARVVGIAPGPTDVDLHIAADAPAQFLQPLQERREAGLPVRIVRGLSREHADPPHPLALLRPRRDRPRSRPAEKRG
jgi:hypothetical protein